MGSTTLQAVGGNLLAWGAAPITHTCFGAYMYLEVYHSVTFSALCYLKAALEPLDTYYRQALADYGSTINVVREKTLLFGTKN